ncbi:MAG: TRAP transporter large permease subunit, partial [Candidatus Auribacterota bacterium]|nr:TRAP transporter large permease subunit [Candidatus Auribacterota bacterium]
RSIKIKEIPDIALETGVITAVVFILIATGNAFSWVITFARIPHQILPVILGDAPSMLEVLLVVNAAYFIGCMFVDNIVVIMVLTPIIYPTAMSVGINPIALGVMISLQAAMGSATPPLGCDIFTAMAIFRRPYLEIIRNVAPFTLIEVVVIFILIFFPQVALFLGNFAGG